MEITLNGTLWSLTSLTGTFLMLMIVGSMASSVQDSSYLENSQSSTGDFSISACATSLTIQQSYPETSQTVICNIKVTSLNGFSGTISFLIDAPKGFTTGITPLNSTGFNLESGGSTTGSLSLSSTVSGSFQVNVTGTIGSLAHSITLPVTVTVPPPDFTITANPDSLHLKTGSSGNSTLAFTSLFGFSGNVTLSAKAYNTVYPWHFPYNVTASLNSTSVTLYPNSTAKATVQIDTATTTPTGYYQVYINGVSGNMTRQAFVYVGVGPYFTMSISPRSISIPAGTSGSFNITLTSFANFTSDITLRPQIYLPGPLTPCVPVCDVIYPSVTISPSTVTLTSFGTAKANLTVSTNSSTTPGNYTIVVFGGGCVCLLPTSAAAAEVSPPMKPTNSLGVFSNPYALLVIGSSTATMTIATSLFLARRKRSLRF